MKPAHVTGSAALRALEIMALATCALVVIGLGWLIRSSHIHQLHRHECDRIGNWINAARGFPPPGIDRLSWNNSLTAAYNVIPNYLYSEKRVSTATLRGLADHLDATQGSELATMEGLLGFIARIEEICPAAQGYGPFEMVREEFGGTTPAGAGGNKP